MSSYSLVEQRYRRLVRQVLYGLRRQYGSHIAVYKLIDADTDYSTGVKTIEKTSYEVVAITAPGKVAREVLQSISQISANKTMVYGGAFDSTVKTFVIDGRHLPGDFEFGMDDWIVYNNARFELKDIYKLDYHAGWIITAKATIGQHAEQIFHLYAGNRLYDLNSYAEAVSWTAHFIVDTIPIDHDIFVQKVMYRSAESVLILDHFTGLDISQIDVVQNDLVLDQSASAQKAMYRSVIEDGLVFNTLGVSIEVFKVINRIFGNEKNDINVQHSVSTNGSIWNREVQSDIGVTQGVASSIFRDRDATSIIGISQSVALSKVIYANANSDIGVNHYLNTLATDLISAWHMDELGGVRYDSWGNNHLTDWNTVGYANGVVANAADFIRANDEYLYTASSDLQVNNTDFAFSFWVNFDTVSNNQGLLSKWISGNQEYEIRYNNSRIRFRVSDTGSNSNEVVASNLGKPVIGTWYHIYCWHEDGVELGIRVNDNLTYENILSHTAGVVADTTLFMVGHRGGTNQYFDGMIDAIHFWKRLLTPEEISHMYNNGTGRQLPPFPNE